MSGGKRIELCSTDEVAPGAALKVEIEDLALAVFNVGGEFFVTDDACTVTLRLLGPYLVASDNGGCGGMNVHFTGVYRRH